MLARTIMLSGLLLLTATLARAQGCPEENLNGPPKESAPQSLVGQVVYHDEIRKWVGLQLDAPVCGQKEIQLLQGGGGFEVDEFNARPVEVFRGCRVTTRGSLGIPGTGYYSADIYQNVDSIDPAQDCIRQPAFPDYTKTKPSPSIHNYRVLMTLCYRARGGSINIQVQSKKKHLNPWQAYTSYWLTGGYAFYGNCAEGFTMSDVHGTPEAKPWTMDNQVLMDPESAAAKQVQWVRVQFRCHKQP